jgi:hypothetical protein
MPTDELRRCLVAAVRGGWLAGYALLGALMARLRKAPDEAVDLALQLADSEDEWTSFQGLTVAHSLVPTAIALNLIGQPPVNVGWFVRLASALEDHARRIFENRGRPLVVSGLSSLPLDLGHVFLARHLVTGDLLPLVDELRASARRAQGGERYLLGEIEIIRGLGNLPRAGQSAVAPEALALWRHAPAEDDHDRKVLDTLAETLAEMLAAFPSVLEGWLEQSGNQPLEARVREKLLEVDSDQLVYRYGPYMMIIFGSSPVTSRKLVPVMEDILKPARDMEHAITLLGEFLFDPDQMPFLW